MDLRQLSYFVAVAEQLSFTRAADRLHVSQPTLSVQISRLERELGVELLDRSRRAVSLTYPGELMLRQSRDLLTSFDRGIQLVQRAGAGQAGHLRAGIVPMASHSVVPSLLRRFDDTHPDVELELNEASPRELIDGLGGQYLDVAFLYLPCAVEGLVTRVVSRECLVAALPAGHALAGRSEIEVSALRDEPFLLPADHGIPGLRGQVLSACHRAGFRPRTVQENVWMMQTLMALVAAGIGVALVPSSLGSTGIDGVTLRPLNGRTQPEISLAATWSRHATSRVLGAFLDSLTHSSTGDE